MDNDKEFSPLESLNLIRSMIETTRYSLKDSSHYYLMWGYTVVIGCLLQYVLKVEYHYPRHYHAWFITIVALVIHFAFVYRDRKHDKVETFISDAYGKLWMAVGLSFFVMSMIFVRIGFQYAFPFFILMYGIGTFVSGSLIKFKWLQYGGAICGVLAILCSYVSYDNQILLTALALVISYIIPGHLLRLSTPKQNAL
jgi:hypothetical protein